MTDLSDDRVRVVAEAMAKARHGDWAQVGPDDLVEARAMIAGCEMVVATHSEQRGNALSSVALDDSANAARHYVADHDSGD